MPRPYESFDLDRLKKTRREWSLMASPTETWRTKVKIVFFVFGLIIFFGGIANLFERGLDFINGLVILIGGLAIYLWHKQEQSQKFIWSEIDLMDRELSSRGER